MPSLEQVAYANAERERLMRAELEARTDSQARLAAQQAADQAARDNQLNQVQQAQTLQQQQLQAEREGLSAQYARQQQVLGAGLQERRDYYGQQNQLQQMGVGAELQSRRDTQLSAQRQQEAEQGANLSAQLSQVQLNQKERLRIENLRQAISSVDEDVQSGRLDPETAASLRTQLVTGLNPLQHRAQQEDILRSQLQRQSIEQQNEHQATLFAQRQQRVAAGAAGNIQSVFNPDTGRTERYMVDVNTGGLSPLESSSIEQARQLHLLQTGQSIQQSNAMFPGQLEAQQVNIAGARGANSRAEALLPGTVQHQQLANQQLAQTMQFQSQMQPGNVQHQGLVNDSIVQNLSQGAAMHPGIMQMQGAQLADLTQRTRHAAQQQPLNMALLTANADIAKMHADQEPSRFRNEQEHRAAQTQALQANALLDNARIAQQGQAPPLPVATVNSIVSSINTQVNREITDARGTDQNAMPSWFVVPQTLRDLPDWYPGRQGMVEAELRRQTTERVRRLTTERIQEVQRQSGRNTASPQGGGNALGGGSPAPQGGPQGLSPRTTPAVTPQAIQRFNADLENLAGNNEEFSAATFDLRQALGAETPDFNQIANIANSLPPEMLDNIQVPQSIATAIENAMIAQQTQTRVDPATVGAPASGTRPTRGMSPADVAAYQERQRQIMEAARRARGGSNADPIPSLPAGLNSAIRRP